MHLQLPPLPEAFLKSKYNMYISSSKTWLYAFCRPIALFTSCYGLVLVQSFKHTHTHTACKAESFKSTNIIPFIVTFILWLPTVLITACCCPYGPASPSLLHGLTPTAEHENERQYHGLLEGNYLHLTFGALHGYI